MRWRGTPRDSRTNESHALATCQRFRTGPKNFLRYPETRRLFKEFNMSSSWTSTSCRVRVAFSAATRRATPARSQRGARVSLLSSWLSPAGMRTCDLRAGGCAADKLVVRASKSHASEPVVSQCAHRALGSTVPTWQALHPVQLFLLYHAHSFRCVLVQASRILVAGGLGCGGAGADGPGGSRCGRSGD